MPGLNQILKDHCALPFIKSICQLSILDFIMKECFLDKSACGTKLLIGACINFFLHWIACLENIKL